MYYRWSQDLSRHRRRVVNKGRVELGVRNSRRLVLKMDRWPGRKKSVVVLVVVIIDDVLGPGSFGLCKSTVDHKGKAIQLLGNEVGDFNQSSPQHFRFGQLSQGKQTCVMQCHIKKETKQKQKNPETFKGSTKYFKY